MREHIACNNHVGLVSIHGEPVHPQKLGQQCVTMTLHNELSKERKLQSVFIYVYICALILFQQSMHVFQCPRQ